MEKLLILFLSTIFIFPSYSCKAQKAINMAIDCTNKHIQDSIVAKYIDSGAEKLPYMYNNAAWQTYCDSIIALCPNIATAYQHKAVPFIKNGEYEKAFALNDKAVALDPKGYMAYRGFLKCIFTKDYKGALSDFKKAQEITPDGVEMDHTYEFYEGLCNLELGNYPEAQSNFQKDILIQNGGNENETVHFNTLLYFGILYFETKNYNKAEEYLQKCLAIYKNLPEANYYLALVYKTENNIQLKKKYLEIAKQSIKDGYRMNEDNMYYANYPYQITLYEIEKELE